MLLSDLALKLNQSGRTENRKLPRDLHRNEANDDLNSTENVEKWGEFSVAESISYSDNKEINGDNLISPLGVSGKEPFRCSTCGENSTARSSAANEVSNNASVTNGDGVVNKPIIHASKRSSQSRVIQDCFKTEYAQKVMLVHANSQSLTSYSLPRHVSSDHLGCSCCKTVLLNVGMSEREVKAKITSTFKIADQEG